MLLRAGLHRLLRGLIYQLNPFNRRLAYNMVVMSSAIISGGSIAFAFELGSSKPQTLPT